MNRRARDEHREPLTAIFESRGALRSRSVSPEIRTAILDVPLPPASVIGGWQREIAGRLELAAGDIEPLPLGRTRLQWPQLRHCIDAVRQWLAANDMPGILADAPIALMGSRGTRYHHDGARYGGMAFCNLFLGDAPQTELHWPAIGRRIALARGTVVLFDPCQPHAIIGRGATRFDAADFAIAWMPPQVFLTWELPIEHADVTKVLGIALDVVPPPGAFQQGERVWSGGEAPDVCPTTGAWLPVGRG